LLNTISLSSPTDFGQNISGDEHAKIYAEDDKRLIASQLQISKLGEFQKNVDIAASPTQSVWLWYFSNENLEPSCTLASPVSVLREVNLPPERLVGIVPGFKGG